MAFQGVWDLYPEGGIMVPEGEPISHDTNHLYHS